VIPAELDKEHILTAENWRLLMLCITFRTLPAQSITGLDILTKDNPETLRMLLRVVDGGARARQILANRIS
jgi:hypothetical protein